MMDPLRVQPAVALVYDQDCPNVGECRIALRAALSAVGAPPVWNEWDRNSSATPVAYRGLGSPTVLVNGRDICGPTALSAHGNSCRLYPGDAGRSMCGAPSVTTIVNALLAEQQVVWNA
jgi:mercuric ion transport protein